MEGDIIVIAPDGDLLIILIPENDTQHDEEIVDSDSDDEENDTQDGEENFDSDSDDADPSTYTWNLPTLRSTQERKFKVSLKHMTMACRRAKIMFSGNWKEATCIYPDGFYHWTIRGRFDDVAFEDVLLLMHACPRKISSPIGLGVDLCEVAFVFDDLQCNPAMARFFEYPLKSHCDSKDYVRSWGLDRVFEVMHASSVLQFDVAFKTATKRAIYLIKDTVNIPTRLIAAKILDGIKRRRIEFLVQLNSALLELEDSLDEKNCTVCHFGDSRCEEQLGLKLKDLISDLFSFREGFAEDVPRSLTVYKALNVVYHNQKSEATTRFSGEHKCDLHRILLRAFKQAEHGIEGLELKDFVQRQE